MQNEIKLLPRKQLIPDITATSANLTTIAGFLTARGVTKARLLVFNPGKWHDKIEKIDIQNLLQKNKKTAVWVPQKKIEAYRSIFTNKGIHTG